MRGQTKISPYWFLALAPLLWSGNFVIGKVLADTFPPFTLSAIRWTIGALVLLPVLLRQRPRPAIQRQHWLSIVILGVTGIFLYTALLYLALHDTTTLNASLIQAAIPMVTVLMAVLLFREVVTPRQWIGIVAAFAGVAWIVSGGRPDALAALMLNRGDVLMVADVFLWAIYTLIGQRILRSYTPLVATFYAMLVGLIFLYPAAVWEMREHVWPSLSWPLLAALLYLGVFPSIVAYVFWYKGVAAVGASKSSVFVNLLPVYTAALAAVFLGETIALYHIVGGALVAGGVYWGSRVSGSGSPERAMLESRQR